MPSLVLEKPGAEIARPKLVISALAFAKAFSIRCSTPRSVEGVH